MNSFKSRAEKYRIDTQMEMVSNRNSKGSIKPVSRQKLIDIVSMAWEEVHKEVIVKGLETTGIYGDEHASFLSHQKSIKSIILDN